MRNILLIILFIALSCFPCHGKGNPIPFSPIVQNFSVSDYGAGSQNWAIDQDERDVMYFANNKGLLEYDGSHWALYPIVTGDVVRAVYVASDERIYVGAFEEFGYFRRNDLNLLEYHSLKQDVSGFDFHNDEIWEIIEFDGKIIFQSFGSLFVYDGKTTKGYRLDQLPLNLFNVNGTVYSQLINGGLTVFTGTAFRPFLSRQLLGNDDVMAGMPYPGGMLLLTRNKGGFIYNASGITAWHTECDEELKHHTVNRAVMTKDSSYVVGTLSNGVYAFDRQGRLLWKVNADNQLVNNTVLGFCCDANNNVWVALDNGIAYIRNNSLIYHYEPVNRKMGMIYDVLVREDDAYIASNQGLYRLSDDRLNILPGLEEQAWTINEWGKQVLCGHNKGTFQISGMHSTLISDIRGAMCFQELQSEGQDLLLQGTYTYLNVFRKSPSGEWYFANSIKNFSHMVKQIEIDHRGNVWFEHMRKGLYRLRINPQYTKVVDFFRYDSLSGQGSTPTSLFKVNGRIVFSDGEQFYTYDDIADSIIPYRIMNEQLPALQGIHSVNHMKGDLYWFLSDREAYLVRSTLSRFSIEGRIPFATFGNFPIEGHSRMVYDKKRDCSYLCLNNLLAKVDADSSALYRTAYKTSLYVSGLAATDRLSGRAEILPVKEDNKVRADYNTITISLAYPEYYNASYSIRYKLDGLSDKWYEGLPRMKKEYPNLAFGSYRFEAEVYDDTGMLSSVSLPFAILRPWYLTYAAITIYVLLFLIGLFFSFYMVYVYTKRKKDKVIALQRIRHQAEIEQQEKKIMELEKEQLEADLRFKSKELSGVVMTNIVHQEFLTNLKEEIQQQKLSGQFGRRNLDKLLAMINQNIISDEESWSMFQANFDRIHENFFRHLKEKYPELTSGDLRLCALLRLNLPTKEISKLMSISTRGVDAARYRLRKKLGLAPESSLTDFMINFK